MSKELDGIYMQQQYLNLWGMTVSKKEDVLYIYYTIHNWDIFI